MSRQNRRHKPAVLIIGAGLAGMTAAHHLAEWGAQVYLADRAPHLGGAFLLLDHTFTTDSCGLCLALPRQPSYCPTIASELDPRITCLPGTTLAALTGQAGDFVARLAHAPRYIDPDRCDHCGDCLTVCPVSRPSWYGEQKAIYAPPPRATPYVYAIDPQACTRCGACIDACPAGAIDLTATPTKSQIEIDAILLSPGLVPFDAARAVEYGWGRYANVITSLEFEYMLNLSGPTGGQLLRPSDHLPPQNIAFIHCVGSRSEKLGRPLCSTSCCMITAKQVGLAKKVAPETEIAVFTIDIRTAGKGYERYFQRVAAQPGVTYRRGLPAAVHKPTGERNLRLLTPDGEQRFDLVVLAVGMGPPDGIRDLAARAGAPLDEHGFILPGDDGPGSTMRAGVFAAGGALSPADVPETVTQAAAAAALIAQTLRPDSPPASRHEAENKDQRVEKQALDRPPRIGLFFCDCQGALPKRFDLPALAAWSRSLRAVVHVEQVQAACESPGQASIAQAMTKHQLNRIVVAGCSPRLYGERFDELLAGLGLPPQLLARVDIRTGAASDFVQRKRRELAIAVAGLRETPYTPLNVRAQAHPADRVLVLGGGLAGMTAALTLADLGVACDLVERETRLGGNLRHSVRTLEGIDAQALLADTVTRVQQNGKIRTLTGAELTGWDGVRGDFAAEMQIDGETRQERYGALIVATGARQIEPQIYMYGQHPNVITQRELSLRLAQSPPIDLHSVVMIQCAGSRDQDHPYCSRVCCAQAIQNALTLKERDPAVQVSILFRDMRTLGQHELSYRRARQLGVLCIRYAEERKPLLSAQPEQVQVTVWDELLDSEIVFHPDLVVLSAGIEPDPGSNALAQLIGAPLDEDGFLASAHPKLRPTDLPQPGVFVCGLAYGPRFIAESMTQARATALRAALVVARRQTPRRDVAVVIAELCSFCGLCVAHCPYGARVLDEKERFARVIDHLCQGCGLCVAACPNGASRQPALEPAQLLAMVDAALID